MPKVWGWNPEKYQLIKEYKGVNIYLHPEEELFGCQLPTGTTIWYGTIKTIKSKIDAALFNTVDDNFFTNKKVFVTGQFGNIGDEDSFFGVMTGKSKGKFEKKKRRYNSFYRFPRYEIKKDTGEFVWIQASRIMLDVPVEKIDKVKSALEDRNKLQVEVDRIYDEIINPINKSLRENSLSSTLKRTLDKLSQT